MNTYGDDSSDNGELTGFAPVVSKKSKILILGSMPGQASLEKNQYYGHPRNHFWRIIFDIHEATLCDNYKGRCNFLLENGIGLWDVISSCRRKGSLDTHIENARVNDFELFFNNYPGIFLVCFNGMTAFKLYRRWFGSDDGKRRHIRLPSTSPAHTMPYEKKLALWKEAFL